VLFDDGKVVIRWLSNISSIVIHDNIENFRKVSVPKGYRKMKWISKYHCDLSDEMKEENNYLESKTVVQDNSCNNSDSDSESDSGSDSDSDNEENDKMEKKYRQQFEERKMNRFSHWQIKINQINRFRFANNQPKIKDEDLLHYLEKQFKPAYLDFQFSIDII
jgi:hypothetical protein